MKFGYLIWVPFRLENPKRYPDQVPRPGTWPPPLIAIRHLFFFSIFAMAKMAKKIRHFRHRFFAILAI
ncbi:MAG: hypothetical protein GY820_20195, partial [Gammaproteobacteria bacterium]|nr:hypothetical protein [Gammaproteobacteria bacterium]